MLRCDGSFLIYKIQHDYHEDGEWTYSNFDTFGTPPGFSASSECWQKTGIHGTFDKIVARDGLFWIRHKNPGTKFRLVSVVISQITQPIR